MPFRMPFFKSKDGEPAAHAAVQHESVELMRKRARHRLIGATVLILLGVVGFPLLFDTQPRPISVDIPIEIPDKAKVRPLAIPAAPGAAVVPASPPAKGPLSSGPVVAGPVTAAQPAPKVAASASLAPKEEIVAAKPAAPAPSTPQEAKPAAPVATAKAPEDSASRAKALLEGKSDPAKGAPDAAAAGGARFVVQAGAFADADKARETRLKIERAGMKTYTQVAQTKDGNRIRVRVGPFATRADADKALARIKALDLSAAILTL